MRGWWAPHRLFFGPIFQKDVSVSGRGRAVYAARGLFALGLALIVGAVFMGQWANMRGTGSPTGRLQNLQGIAPMIFRTVVSVQFGVFLLLAPALSGGTVCDEKRTLTLGPLLTTPLTPLEIICSKISSRLVQLLILGLLTTPVLLGVRLFGGVRADAILISALLSLVGALVGLSLGVLLSTRAKRPSHASLGAYFLLAALFFAPPVAIMQFNAFIAQNHPGLTLADMLGSWAPAIPMRIPEWIAAAVCLPVAFGLTLAGAGGAGGAGGGGLEGVWLWAAGIGLAYAACFTLLAAWSLRGVMRRQDAGSKKSRGAARSRVVSDHPILWRELRQPLFASRLTRWVGAIAAVGLGSWIVIATEDPFSQPLMMIPGIIGSMAFLAQSAMLTSTSLGAERESRTLDTLLTTRLTPSEIVWGKFLGTLRRQWLVPAALLVFYLWLMLEAVFHPMLIAHLALALVGPMVMLAGTAVLFGQKFRKGSTAAFANAALAVGLWVVVPFTAALLFGVLSPILGEPPEMLGNITIFAHPVGTVVMSLASFYESTSWTGVEVDLPTGDISAPAMLIVQLVPAIAYSAVGIVCLLLAIARFKRDTGRNA